MKKKLTGVVIGGMMLAGLGVIAPAQAALTTHCVGEAADVTVPGDLVVPRGESCALSGVTVDGDVRVSPGADLVADGLTVDGRIAVQADAYLDLADSTVSGNVVNRGSFGVYLDNTDLNAYTANANVNPDTFLWTLGTTFSGRIAATG